MTDFPGGDFDRWLSEPYDNDRYGHYSHEDDWPDDEAAVDAFLRSVKRDVRRDDAEQLELGYLDLGGEG